MYPSLKDSPVISIDVETTGLRWYHPDDYIFGFAVSTIDQDFYFDLRESKAALHWLRTENLKGHIRKVVNHNIKFDLHMLWKERIKIDPAICECTQIRAALIDEHLLSYSLDTLSQKYLGAGKHKALYEVLAKQFGGACNKSQMSNISKAPIAIVSEYAKKDTRLAFDLYLWQEEEIKKQGLEHVYDVERQLFPVIFDMESTGIRIDEERIDPAIELVESKVIEKKQFLKSLVGFDFNINSNADLCKVFKPAKKADGFVLDNGLFLPKTASGLPSFKKDYLEKSIDERIQAILEIKTLVKCSDTYLKSQIRGSLYKGFVYPSIHQCKADIGGDVNGTKTGRLSMSGPAIQQIPARYIEIASILRPLFLPKKREIWHCEDYRQFEFRIFSHYINNPKINAIYQKDPDFDFHKMVADMTGLPKPKAKTLNLGSIYGMGRASIARCLNLPTVIVTNDKGHSYETSGPEASKIIYDYECQIPGIKFFGSSAQRYAEGRGFVRTLSGRKLRFPNKRACRTARALLCQGSSADLVKFKMVQLHAACKAKGVSLLLSVHDEFNLSVPEGTDTAFISEVLEDFDISVPKQLKLRIPIRTEYGTGKNWGQASGKGG